MSLGTVWLLLSTSYANFIFYVTPHCGNSPNSLAPFLYCAILKIFREIGTVMVYVLKIGCSNPQFLSICRKSAQESLIISKFWGSKVLELIETSDNNGKWSKLLAFEICKVQPSFMKLLLYQLEKFWYWLQFWYLDPILSL